MTRRRWIADEVNGNTAAIIGSHADHLTRVLRARVGEEFDVATRDTLRRGRISAIQDGRVEFELGDEIVAPATPDISLLLAIYKFDRMEWAIEKATELGVVRIVPVIAQRIRPPPHLSCVKETGTLAQAYSTSIRAVSPYFGPRVP